MKVTATEIGAGENQAPKSARALSAMAMNVKRRGFAWLGAVGYWHYGAFACAVLAVASLIAILIPNLAPAAGFRFYGLAAISTAGALFCAFIAVANRIGIATAIHGTPDDVPLSPRRLIEHARAAGLEPELHALTYTWRRLPERLQRAFTALDALGSRPRAAPFGHTLLLIARKPAA